MAQIDRKLATKVMERGVNYFSMHEKQVYHERESEQL